MNIFDFINRGFNRKKDINAQMEVYYSDEMKNDNIRYDDCALNLKIENFFKWYYKNMLNEHYDEDIKEEEVLALKNFVEKVAIWYELRYPDNYISRMMDTYISDDANDINDIMFKDNKYLEEFDYDFSKLNWSDFYNPKVFLNSLPSNEREYLKKPKYPEFIHFSGGRFPDDSVHITHGFIDLTANGKITDFYGLYFSGGGAFRSFEGKTLKEFYESLKNKGFIFKNNKDLEKVILEYENKKLFKDKLLDCIMFRIIERGGMYFGPRRGYLFAKEFGRDIDIPMMYCVNYYDSNRRAFINLYLKEGGNKDLKGYYNYFYSNSGDEIKLVNILDYLNDCDVYTEEEINLYERLVNSFVVYKNLKNSEKEQSKFIEQKRLQRRLDKSRNNCK